MNFINQLNQKINVKKIILLAILIFSSFAFSSLANAQVFMTTNSSGGEKTSFMSNETMYVVANNITNGSAPVKLYLMSHNSSLANQTVFIGQALGPIDITANSSGGFDNRVLWNPNSIPGTYDLFADVNRNNIYDSGTCGTGADCLYTAGGNGIIITRAPIPHLSFSTGPKSPASHSYTYDSTSPNSLMLQIKIIGDIVEPALISSFDFIPSGTGDDKNGISVVKMFDDSNGNGIVDQGESLVGYAQYLGDDGVLRLDLSSSPFRVNANSTVYLLIQYTMSNLNSPGSTFSTQLVSITAKGQNTLEKAVVTGLPVTSGVTTIAGTTTTSTTSSTTTTTTTVPADECSENSDCGTSSCSNGKQSNPTCTVDAQKGISVCTTTTATVSCCPGEKCGGFDFDIMLLVVAAVIAFTIPAIYFFFIRKPSPQPEHYQGP
ncbi:MAG: hypothetical protein V1944_02075 [Candidatus Aenigmatarchaeota archaeon]